MKTLVIVTHPDIETSVVNKRWIEELNKYPDLYTVHQLHKAYPDEVIDVQAEQKLIERHGRVVFQFPFYWFSCPGLLKKWLDVVVLHGWAYGSKSGYKMANKKIALALSVGVDEQDYQPGQRYKYTMEELLRPFELSFEYVKADYRPFFAYYGMEFDTSAAWVEKSVPLYMDFLKSL